LELLERLELVHLSWIRYFYFITTKQIQEELKE